MKYEDYLKQVSLKFISDYFNLEAEVQFDKYRVDLFAMSKVHIEYRDQGNAIDPLLGAADYRLTFTIIFMPNVSSDLIKLYSKAAYKFIYDKVSDMDIFHRFVIPVIASNGFSDEVKSYVRSFSWINFRPPVTDSAHPVLVELDTDTIYHNSKVTLMYSRAKEIPIKAVEKYLILGNMKKK